MTEHEIDHKDLPVIFFEDGDHILNPTPVQIANKLGRNPSASENIYDVAIIGVGPAGLAAGDVRAGAMNRVASAVGEGSMAIKYVHEYFADSNL